MNENDYVAGYLQAQNEELYKAKIMKMWNRTNELILASAIFALVIFFGTANWAAGAIAWVVLVVAILITTTIKARRMMRTYGEVRSEMPVRGSVSTAAAQDASGDPEGPQKPAYDPEMAEETTVADGICVECGGHVVCVEVSAYDGSTDETKVVDTFWEHEGMPEEPHPVVPLAAGRPKPPPSKYNVLDEQYAKVSPDPECTLCKGKGHVEVIVDDVTKMEPCGECIVPSLTGPDWIAVTEFGTDVTNFYPIGSTITLGEIANVLQELKRVGVKWQSLEYAMKRVWGEEIETERRLLEEIKEMFARRAEVLQADAQKASDEDPQGFIKMAPDGTFKPLTDPEEK